MPIKAVCKVCSVSESTIYQAAAVAQLGSPGHFVWNGHCMVYTPAGLCQLVQGLCEIDQPAAASLLAEEVRRLRQQAATGAGVTTPDDQRDFARRWDIRVERQQDLAA
jgi:hypothetical protein